MSKTLLLLFLAIVIVAYGQLFIRGVHVANDFPLASQETVKEGFNLPQTWTSRWAEGMGQSNVATLWSWPTDYLYGFGARVGIDFSILEKVLGFLPIIIIGYLSLNKLLKELGIKNANIHTFRHTFASYMIMNGVDIVTVKELLGHSDITTTMRYAHLMPNHKMWAVNKLKSITQMGTNGSQTGLMRMKQLPTSNTRHTPITS